LICNVTKELVILIPFNNHDDMMIEPWRWYATPDQS